MAEKWKRIAKEGYDLILNDGGPTLGIRSGAAIISQDGFAFKDLNGDGTLEPYEDWRLPFEKRIADLASRMSIEQIAGLMLYSLHQSITRIDFMASFMSGGKEMPNLRERPCELTEDQKKFLKEDNLRHVLISQVEDAPTAAKWNNNVQAFVEALPLGIPVNISTDPRHTPSTVAEFNMGAGGDISMWPEHIGLAAAFDPALVKQFAKIAAKEYRALGITTALSPQIDLASEPRWNRFNGTFGEGTALVIDLARAYCEGFQTSAKEREIENGWGFDSVNAMAKHWPGGGSGEAGRDAHFNYGKYAIFPGNNFEEAQKPFTEGAFKLSGGTKICSAIMPYYTISWNIDEKYGENVANSYSRYIITDLLREKYGFEGVVCTDWAITKDPQFSFVGGKCWGVENLSVAERHYKILKAGVDQFGGNNDVKPVLEAYRMGITEFGEKAMRERFELSARRLLANIFRTGLFENPYTDPVESRKTVGCAEFVKAGYEAQLKSLLLLKNKGSVLPLEKGIKVYVPIRHINAGTDWFGRPTPAHDLEPAGKELVSEYFIPVDTPEYADAALCFIESPKSTGYTQEEKYKPISLQYRPYAAKTARERSIAGDEGEERSYLDKQTITMNEPDLDMVLNTKKAMGDKPVIVVVHTTNPFIPAEFEKAVDAIMLDFDVEKKAIFSVISGMAEPSALLPFQMPQNMETVEAQLEDVPRDMTPYRDECGNVYDFAYGLNWSGVINDSRVKTYR